jgi:hypothetical protein
VQARSVVPVHPTQGGQFDIFDYATAPTTTKSKPGHTAPPPQLDALQPSDRVFATGVFGVAHPSELLSVMNMPTTWSSSPHVAHGWT